jgi:hypothetical protein
MEQNIQNDLQIERIIELCKIALSKYEPYPFDEPKLQMYDNDLDENRVTATMAKKFLIEHGIEV